MLLRAPIFFALIVLALHVESKNKSTNMFSSLPVDSSSFSIAFNRVGNLIVVKAKVDTTEGNFILDTGAPYLVLNLTYFRDYPISSYHSDEQSNISGMNMPLNQTTIKEFKLGSLRLYRIDADLTELGRIENLKGIKVLGLLGMDLFKEFEMIIDYETNLIRLHRVSKKEIKFYKHDCLTDTSLYNTFSIELKDDRIITTGEIAGKKLRLLIDCGAETSILNSRLPNSIFEDVNIIRRIQIAGAADKKVDAVYGNLNQIKIGNLKIDHMPVVILNLKHTCFSNGWEVDGVLGLDFLSQHKIGFNFPKKLMYIWK